MSALPNLVNAQTQSLTSVNKNNSSKTDLKDSVKEPKADIAELISAVLKKGTNENIGSNLAPVIGLPNAMPIVDVEVEISKKAAEKETRNCFVVYEHVENPGAEGASKRALSAYAVRRKRSDRSTETKYFRLSLKGDLEKVVISKGKFDKHGKIVRGSGIKTDLDVDSPEVRKTFEAEMKFWLKDWLKKEQRNAAKKTAGAAAKTPSTTAL